MKSILALLNTKVPGVINAKDYSWEKIWGSKDIIEYAKSRTIKHVVNVEGEPDRKYFTGYAQCYLSTTDGVQFTDGTCLVCSSTSEFAGTFASHDAIETNYFLLKPETK